MSNPVNYYISRKRRYLIEFDLIARSARSVIARHFEGESSATLLAEARREFEALIPQLPYIGGRQPLSEFVVFTAMFLSVYRVSQERGRTAEKIGILIFEISEAFLSPARAPLLRMLMPTNFSPKRWSGMRKRAAESHRREYPQGYVYDFVAGDGETFDYGIDYLECASCKFLAKQGASEIALYLCPVDLLYSEALGWGLTRTMTLAEGASRCDFRFKKGGPTRVAVPAPIHSLINRED